MEPANRISDACLKVMRKAKILCWMKWHESIGREIAILKFYHDRPVRYNTSFSSSPHLMASKENGSQGHNYKNYRVQTLAGG
jgi:hypothetical protein